MILVSAGVQGTTGFGHGLLAIGFLAMFFGSKEAVLILTLLSPVISVVTVVAAGAATVIAYWGVHRLTRDRGVPWMAAMVGRGPRLWRQ